MKYESVLCVYRVGGGGDILVANILCIEGAINIKCSITCTCT